MNTQLTAPHDGGRKASIVVKVIDAKGGHAVVANAWIGLYRTPDPFDETAFDPRPLPSDTMLLAQQRTDLNGTATFYGLDPGVYVVAYLHLPQTDTKWVRVHADCIENICLEPVVDASVTTVFKSNDCKPVDCRAARQGDYAEATLRYASGLNAKSQVSILVVAPTALRAFCTL